MKIDTARYVDINLCLCEYIFCITNDIIAIGALVYGSFLSYCRVAASHNGYMSLYTLVVLPRGVYKRGEGRCTRMTIWPLLSIPPSSVGGGGVGKFYIQ